MRYLITLFSFTIFLGVSSQESYRNFNEVNPALENLYNKNLVFRNIQNADAVYNYFHLHTNRFARKIITSLDIQTKTFDLKSTDQIQLSLKANYQFRIRRNLSIYAGLSGGMILSENENRGFITPGLALATKKFQAGYNTQLTQINSQINFEHSSQSSYTFSIPYGIKSNHSTNPITGKTYATKKIKIKLSYLNYWSKTSPLNQYLVTQTKFNNISLLLGVNSNDMKNINPLFGLGVNSNRFALQFQTVLTKSEIKEMQVSISYDINRMIRRHHSFRMTIPDF